MREMTSTIPRLFLIPGHVVASVQTEVRVAPLASVQMSAPVVDSLIITSLLAALLALL